MAKAYLLIASIVILGAVFLFPQHAQAVTVSQLLPEFVAKPGDTIDQTIQLYDDSLQGVTVYPVVYNFTADPDKEGAVLVLTEEKDLKPDREWLQFNPDPIELPADGSLVDFPYQIVIPENGEPGTHLISLVFQTKPQASDNTASGSSVYIGTNVAVNMFLKVLGATIDKIDVDFQVGSYTNTDDTLSPAERAQYFEAKNFFIKPPVDFLVTVQNTGNTHQKPDGNIKIVNDLLHTDPEKLDVNAENRIILPGTERTFGVSSFGQGFMFGKYRAKITMLYGDPLRPIEREVVFWIVPVVEIAIALAILLLIITIIIIVVKVRRKRRTKREIEREEALRQKIIEELKGKKPDTAANSSGSTNNKTGQSKKPKPQQKKQAGKKKNNAAKGK